MSRRALILGASALLALGACSASPGVSVRGSGKPPCRSAVVVVPELRETGCDVLPGQRLDVEMAPTGGLDAIRARCDAMGGDDLVTPADAEAGEYVCEGVDF